MDPHQVADQKDQTFGSSGPKLILEGHWDALLVVVPKTATDQRAEMIGPAGRAVGGMAEDTVQDQPSGRWRLGLRAFRHAGIRAL